MANYALPYRTAQRSVEDGTTEWSVRIGEEVLENPGYIPGWDALLRFECSRTISINMAEFFSETGLPPHDSTSALVVTLRSARNRWRQRSYKEMLPESGVYRATVQIEPDSGQLAIDLVLETAIVLVSAPAADPNSFAAKRAGSKLWSDTQRFALEGHQARPVMRAVAFSQEFPYQDVAEARYFVDFRGLESGDSEADESMAVYLNTESGFAARVQSRDPHALNDLYEGVALQLCLHVLQNNVLEGTVLEDYTPGSIGYAVARWLSWAFGPDYSHEEARSLAISAPAEFIRGIQAAFQKAGAKTV